MVLEAFLGPSTKHVNHKNGVRDDNRLVNLEYVTPSENAHHAIDVLGVDPRHSVKLTPEAAAEIRRKYSLGEVSRTVLAREYGVSKSSIHMILRNEMWSDKRFASRRRSA